MVLEPCPARASTAPAVVGQADWTATGPPVPGGSLDVVELVVPLAATIRNTSAAVPGFAKWKPCRTSQPISSSSRAVASSSMPSATTVRSKRCPSSKIERTIAASAGEWGNDATKDRSILISSKVYFLSMANDV